MIFQGLGVATQVLIMGLIVFVVLLVLGIVLLIIVHVCVVGRALRAAENNFQTDRTSAGRLSMSRDDLEKLPCYDYMAKAQGSGPGECAVCLDNFKSGDKCRLLPTCRHSFHAQCVDAWLMRTPVCPICRASADSRRSRPSVGDESSVFSDMSLDFRGSLLTESSQFSFSDASIETREGQAAAAAAAAASSQLIMAIRRESGENQVEETDEDIIMEVRPSHGEDTITNSSGINSAQNQEILVGSRLGSDPSPSVVVVDSPSKPVV